MLRWRVIRCSVYELYRKHKIIENDMPDNKIEKLDGLTCPLCKQKNACANISSADDGRACWCNNTTVSFPKGLLEKLPKAERGQACICQACVLVYLKEQQALS